MEKTKDVVSFLKKWSEIEIQIQNDITIIIQELLDTKGLIEYINSIAESIEIQERELNEIDKKNESDKD